MVKVKLNLEQAKKGERSYSSTLSLTSALDGGGWSTPRPGRFTPQEREPVPIVQEAGCAPGQVWTGAENLAPPLPDSIYKMRNTIMQTDKISDPPIPILPPSHERLRTTGKNHSEHEYLTDIELPQRLKPTTACLHAIIVSDDQQDAIFWFIYLFLISSTCFG